MSAIARSIDAHCREGRAGVGPGSESDNGPASESGPTSGSGPSSDGGPYSGRCQMGETSILLIDTSDATRQVLARRLRARGYTVEEASDPALGAELALRSPPTVVISDLWMHGISGVQLCRLLRAEPATSELAVLLCGDGDDPRSRFWASRAGANAYVPKRRTSELMRILRTLERPLGAEAPFFLQLNDGATAVRDRIARQLDKALFDSVIASEIRALASAGSFALLFELLLQFLQQVTRYQWLALASASPHHVALHHLVGDQERAERGARAALELPSDGVLHCVEDEDASGGEPVSPPLVEPILVGGVIVGRIAMSPCQLACKETADLFRLVSGELGGPLRMALLVEEAQRSASIDALTGLANRRAFIQAVIAEIARSRRYAYPVSLLLLDVDHFKAVNDTHGHLVGDQVLGAVGAALGDTLRSMDLAGRWGGEEFAILLPHTDAVGAEIVAQRIRETLASRACAAAVGARGAEDIRITVSIGVALLEACESWEALVGRADLAMYAAKRSGRNRVVVGPSAARADG